MTNFLEANEEQYVLAKKVHDFLVAWQAPRGKINSGRWTIEPSEAHLYKNLPAVLTAADRLAKQYPEEFKDIQVLSADQLEEQAKRLNAYESVEALLNQYPDTKTVHLVQFDNKSLFFADKVTATKRKEYLEAVNVDAKLYTLFIRR